MDKVIESVFAAAYHSLVDNQTNDMNDPAEWVDALLSSRAALERGERVRMETVLDRMQAAIDRIEARRAGDPRHA